MTGNVLDFNTLPDDIKQFLEIEDVSGFQEDRYLFSKREMKLFDSIIQADKLSSRFKEKGVRYLNATMLYGQSGTGKTTLGRYVAYKLNLPFAYLNFAKITSSDFGGTSRNIARVFSCVSGKRCVLMLDEIDCISRKRVAVSGESQSNENTRVTITLMQELDKIKSDTIIIGATNIPETLDPALRRRFTNYHEVKGLDSDEMTTFCCRYLDSMDIQYDEKQVSTFCKNNIRISQALIINDLNRCIADYWVALDNGQDKPFFLEHVEDGRK